MVTISLSKVTKRFPNGTAAVRALTLDIDHGEFIVFAGPPGCGKSTALNMIVGMEEISEGELRIDGKVVNCLPPKDRNIAIIFQSCAVYPHMTVRQNLAAGARLARMPRAEIDQRVGEAAKMLGLTGQLDIKPLVLSGGQQQRIAMGRAIARNPKAILMDEPLSNLDSTRRLQLRTTISRVQQCLNVTTIYATSDQSEAMTLGDRIIVLRFGQMQQVGTSQQLYERPVNMFVAGFVGSPSMNFMAGRMEGGALQLPIGEIQLPAEFLQRLVEANFGRDVVVGLRPEHFEDAALLEPAKRRCGLVVNLKPEVLVSVGSHNYASFPVPRPDARALTQVEQVAREIGSEDPVGSTEQLVARLSRATSARMGTPINLWLDIHRLHFFDPMTGLAFGH
jgi:multiple sugar transport system ATP-binding protein